MSVCCCNIGTTYELLSNLEEALEHHEKVSRYTSNSRGVYSPSSSSSCQHLELAKEANNLRGQALALSNISKTYECMANITKACETLESVSTNVHNTYKLTYKLSIIMYNYLIVSILM